MKLTRRQETFMRQLLALYTEFQEPIHYSALAERIGVSRITAYDMLRVLEEKGYVESVYQLASDRTGPGRSTVLYGPTEKAQRAITEMAGAVSAPDWQALTNDIIEQLQEGEEDDIEMSSLMSAILDRQPPEGPPEIRYCTELITIIALHLRHSEKKNLLCSYIPDILGDPEKASADGLNVLAGVSLGLFMAEKGGASDWNQELMVHVKRYYQFVDRMDSKERSLLARNLQNVLVSLGDE